MEGRMSEQEMKSAGTKQAGREGPPRFFSTPELTQRLDLIRHMTDNSDRILLIRGPDGVGKSTVLQRFGQLAREEWSVCHIEADPMLQPDRFFSLLSDCLGVPGKSLTFDHLMDQLEALQSQGRLAVVVIDDAHLLPAETLTALFRLHERCTAGQQALLKILLFATPVIEGQFKALQIEPVNLQFIQIFDIPLFSRNQTATFIAFLLGRDGSLGRSRIEQIFQETDGLPGAIEAKLQQSVKPADSAHRPVPVWRSIVADLPGPALVGAGLLGLLLLLTLLFQDQINVLFQGDVVEQQVDIRPLSPVEQEPVVALELPVPMQEQGAAVLSEMDSGGSEAASAATEGANRQAESAGVIDGLPGVEREPGDAVPQEPIVQTEPADEPVAQEAALPEPALMPEPAAPKSEATSVGIAKSDPQPPVEARSADTSVSVPTVAKPPVVQSEVQSPVQAKEEGFHRDAWLLSRDPAAYTLQLIGLRDEQAAQAFIKHHKLTRQAAYFKTELGGKPWFSVVHGVYVDRNTAVKAVAGLPGAVRRNDVWPRPLGSVQQLIKGR